MEGSDACFAKSFQRIGAGEHLYFDGCRVEYVYGVLKILHVAHAAVYTVGAFVGLLMYTWIANFWLALLGAMVVSGVMGVLIYRGVYFYMLDAPRTVPLIASIGMFVMFTDLLQKKFLMGPYQKALPVEGAECLPSPWAA